MLTAAAAATSFGMAVGMVAALIYLKRQFGGAAPLATVVRVAVSRGRWRWWWPGWCPGRGS